MQQLKLKILKIAESSDFVFTLLYRGFSMTVAQLAPKYAKSRVLSETS